MSRDDSRDVFRHMSDQEWEVELRAVLNDYRSRPRHAGFSLWIEDSELSVVEQRVARAAQVLREVGMDVHAPRPEFGPRGLTRPDHWYVLLTAQSDRFA